jgi:hypothetical protein
MRDLTTSKKKLFVPTLTARMGGVEDVKNLKPGDALGHRPVPASRLLDWRGSAVNPSGFDVLI